MSQNGRLRVLLVEDDEDDYILTRDMLHDVWGDRVQLSWMDQPEPAYQEMVGNRFDVYLLDYRLGAEDGLSLLRRAIGSGCNGVIILLTGQGDEAVDMEALDAGADDYLVKGGIDGHSLARAIRYALRHKAAQAELAEMQRRLADSREDERLHLARELHDGPLQNLIAAQLHFSVLARKIADESLHPQVLSLRRGLKETIDTLRAMCREMRPPTLAPYGLARAIEARLQRFNEEHPEIRISQQLDDDGQSIPEPMRLALYRIFQVAITNVALHGRPDHVWVRLQLDEATIRLEVSDDGRGFTLPPNWLAFAREGHFGLVGAAERAEAIGGRLQVSTSPGQGTTLIVAAPRPAGNVAARDSETAVAAG